MPLPETIPAPWAEQIRTARELARESPRRRERAPGLAGLLEEIPRGGTLVELVGRVSSGRFSVVLAALAAATEAGETAALVDLGDALDPQVAEAVGVDLRRLLWARPRSVQEALASAEATLQSGMPLVVLDLGLPPLPGGRRSEASWLRLARATRPHRATVLVSSPYRVSGTAATAVLEATRPRALWRGAGVSPRLLCGCSTHLGVVKRRGGSPLAARPLTLRIGGDLRERDGGDLAGPAATVVRFPPRRHPE